jgi:two-component system chemotaxis response regulator CheB
MDPKAAGGLTIVQDPNEAAVSYMPEQAVYLFKPDYVVRTKEIINIINRVAERKQR